MKNKIGNFQIAVIKHLPKNLIEFIILDKRHPKKAIIDFKKSLSAIGINIANASGNYIVYKMSGVEAYANNKISKSLELSINDLKSKPSAQNFAVKLTKESKNYY